MIFIVGHATLNYTKKQIGTNVGTRKIRQKKPSKSLNLLGYLCNPGGRGEIRTHGGREPTTVFKTVALNRSATLPKA